MEKRSERGEKRGEYYTEFVKKGFSEWWEKLTLQTEGTKFQKGMSFLDAAGTLGRVAGFGFEGGKELKELMESLGDGDIKEKIDILQKAWDQMEVKIEWKNYTDHATRVVGGASKVAEGAWKGVKSVGNVLTSGYFEDEAPPVPPGTTPGGAGDAAHPGSRPGAETGRTGGASAPDAAPSAPDTTGTNRPDAAHPEASGSQTETAGSGGENIRPEKFSLDELEEREWRRGIGTVNTDAGHDTITDIIGQQLRYKPESFGLTQAEAKNKEYVLKLAVEIARKMKFIEGQGVNYHDIRLGKESIGNISFLLEKQGGEWNVNIVDAHTGTSLSREELLKEGKLYANDKPLKTHHHDTSANHDHQAKEHPVSTENPPIHIPTIEELEAGVRLNDQAIHEKRHENDVVVTGHPDSGSSHQETASENSTREDLTLSEKMTVGGQDYRFHYNDGLIDNIDGPDRFENIGDQHRMDTTMSELTKGVLGNESWKDRVLTQLFIELNLIKTLKDQGETNDSDKIIFLKNAVRRIIQEYPALKDVQLDRNHELLKNL